MTDKIQTLAFNENGVCSLPNKEVVHILTQRIKANPEKYIGRSGVEIVGIDGRATRSQELGRTFQFQVKARDNKDSKTVYIKLCAKWERLDAARQEYETLKLLYRKLPEFHANLGVARPIDYYPELNAYAQESVGVKNLKNYLLKTNSRHKQDRRLAELYDIMGWCARWLHAFHEITMSDESEKFNYHSFVNCEEEDFSFLLLKKFNFSKQTLTIVRDCLCRLEALDGVECPSAMWHFDYTPAHVFLNSGVYVIDILGMDKVPIYDDIGHFIASLTTVNNFPFYPFFDYARARQKLTKIFLKTYWKKTSQDKHYFYLFAHCYQLKYLAHWFGAQYQRVSSKIHPLVGKAYANHRLIKIFEPAILHTASNLDSLLKKSG